MATTLNRLTQSSLLLLSPLLLVGCVSNQSMQTGSDISSTHAEILASVNFNSSVQSPEESPVDVAGVDNGQVNTSQMMSELLLILNIDQQTREGKHAMAPQAPGPELVAGDWLAWECAMVIEPWDMPMGDFE